MDRRESPARGDLAPMTSYLRVSTIVVAFLMTLLLSVGCSKDEPSSPPPPECQITVTEPAEGYVLVPGQDLTISWTAPSTVANVRITMHRGDFEVGVIVDLTENTGIYSWEIVDFGAGSGTGYFIRVSEIASHNICHGDSEHLLLNTK